MFFAVQLELHQDADEAVEIAIGDLEPEQPIVLAAVAELDGLIDDWQLWDGWLQNHNSAFAKQLR